MRKGWWMNTQQNLQLLLWSWDKVRLSLNYSLLDHLKCLQLTSNMFGEKWLQKTNCIEIWGPLLWRAVILFSTYTISPGCPQLKLCFAYSMGKSKILRKSANKNGLKNAGFYWKHAYFLCINNSWLHLIFIILIFYFDAPLHFSNFLILYTATNPFWYTRHSQNFFHEHQRVVRPESSQVNNPECSLPFLTSDRKEAGARAGRAWVIF